MNRNNQTMPERLSFQDFMSAFRAQYEYGVPKLRNRFTISEQMVHKNNKNLHGIIVREHGKSIAPVFYYEDLYDSYCEGASLDECMNEVVSFVTTSRIPDDSFRQRLTTWDEVKDLLILKLVNIKRNGNMLSHTPHMIFGDMALVMQVYMDDDVLGRGAITVDRELMDIWQQSQKVAFDHAMDNMKRYRIQTLDLLDYADSKHPVDPETPRIYVYAYDSPFPGASAIIRLDKMLEFAEEKNMDFYILPVSVHEVLMIEYRNDISHEFLYSMLSSINSDQDLADNMMSESVYLLHRDSKKIVNISDNKEILLFTA